MSRALCLQNDVSSDLSTTTTTTTTTPHIPTMSSPLSASCIFCKIIRGEIPSLKLAETSKVYAFLDIGPTAKGHALVIPKYHGEKLHNIPDEYLAELLPMAKRIAVASKLDVSGLEGEGYNILQNNGTIAHQIVPHVHVHLIPKRDEETGLVVGWPHPAEASEKASLEEVHKEILARL